MPVRNKLQVGCEGGFAVVGIERRTVPDTDVVLGVFGEEIGEVFGEGLDGFVVSAVDGDHGSPG